jgi:pSer/pThr/pTyr-binding forkhead associated (FHA) protein
VQRPGQLHRSTPAELKARRDAERVGVPFVVYRDAGSAQRLLVLDCEREAVTIGRQPASDIALTWDDEVSRAHADLERRGEVWTIVDDGRSRNGSFVNGERLLGRRVLHHGDVIAIGRTQIEFCAPLPELDGSTVAASRPALPTLSPAQRRVLVALCRPFSESRFASPPSNRELAEELVVSVETVKFHLHALFALFGLDELPQHRKRATLARQALERGVILPRDLQKE